MSLPFVSPATARSRAPISRTASPPVKRPKFLGLFRSSWRRYEDFEPDVLAKDLERIRHYYQRRGFYDARSAPVASFPPVSSSRSRFSSRRVSRCGFTRSRSGASREGRARSFFVSTERVALGPGDIFDQEKLEASTKGMAAALADHGYAYAEVVPGAVVDLGPRTVDIAFQVDTGLACRIGAVTFEGLGDLPESVIRRTFGVLRR